MHDNVMGKEEPDKQSKGSQVQTHIGLFSFQTAVMGQSAEFHNSGFRVQILQLASREDSITTFSLRVLDFPGTFLLCFL